MYQMNIRIKTYMYVKFTIISNIRTFCNRDFFIYFHKNMVKTIYTQQHTKQGSVCRTFLLYFAILILYILSNFILRLKSHSYDPLSKMAAS